MSKVIEKTLYRIEELPESIQEKAHQRFSEGDGYAWSHWCAEAGNTNWRQCNV